jgi:hypothetical protein
VLGRMGDEASRRCAGVRRMGWGVCCGARAGDVMPKEERREGGWSRFKEIPSGSNCLV